MAVNNTAKKYSDMEFPLAMKRQDAFALDEKCSLRFSASNAQSVIDRLSGKSGQPDILS